MGEVDFIIEVVRNCLAIESKASTQWRKRDLSGLEAFLGITPHCTEAVQLEDKFWVLPLGLVLS